MDWLKEFLGDELFAQVKAKLEAAGDKCKPVNLAAGGYVGKEKFDAMETRAKTAEADVKTRDGQLDELKKLEPEKMATRITELEAKNVEDAKKHAAELDGMKYEAAVTTYLTGHKFTSNIARDAVAAKLKAAALKTGDDGKLIGADDIIAAIKKDNPGAFEAAAKPPAFGPSFGTPNLNQPGQPTAGGLKGAIAGYYQERGIGSPVGGTPTNAGGMPPA